MTCEVCGNIGHSRNDCPENHEDVCYMNNNNNGYHPLGGQGWNQQRPYYHGDNNFNSNQPSLEDLVYGQAKINETISKRLSANDKTLESISAKMEGLSSAIKI